MTGMLGNLGMLLGRLGLQYLGLGHVAFLQAEEAQGDGPGMAVKA